MKSEHTPSSGHLFASVEPHSNNKLDDASPSCVAESLLSASGKCSITNLLIADWLDVTPDESDQLETWPAAPRFGDPSARRQTSTPTTRDERRGARHEAIREIVARLGGKAPSLRAMTEQLEALGHEVSHVTVRNDYQALELAAPCRPGRGQAAPDLFKVEGSSSLAA